ncbi:hypothetical protein L1049_025017 [Liquidambar formosana]|uniref:SAWADEE domain-containing protein n=1 Tax=Liquidambar formosana TaxID=63359 RepID=A0AAP0RVZ6_LIQFO
MTPGNPNSGHTPADACIEFRASDDAWYSVWIVLSCDTLTVKYCNFSEGYDERFRAGDFKTVKEVDNFGERFRPISAQLQDCECRKVIEGKMVCASHVFSEEDVRFYDAFVEEVEYKEHSFAKGQEECLCKFMLFWQHGPNAGNLTSATIENICLVLSSAQIDPTLAAFLKISRENVKNSSLNSYAISGDNISASKDGTIQEEISSSMVKHKSRPLETKCAMQSGSMLQITEGRIDNHCERIEQDIDLGGGGELPWKKKFKESGYQHIVLIENLERDLSPLTIVEFIHKQTNISTQAYVFPSLSSERYTRGTIVLDCNEKLAKLYKFLENPDHVIISSRGRPWVITDKLPRCDSFRMSIGLLMRKSQNKLSNYNIGIRDEVKVALSGTEEYRTAKRLRDLFMDFADHQKGLHKKLALEERKILQVSHTA